MKTRALKREREREARKQQKREANVHANGRVIPMRDHNNEQATPVISMNDFLMHRLVSGQ